MFERLAPTELPRLSEIYTPDARFKDPFNEVQGVPAIEAIRDVIVQGDQCFLGWDFVFRMKRFSGAEQVIRGATHLRLAADGRIAVHRDYWDAAEELYEKLPAVGALMRWLKRRVNA